MPEYKPIYTPVELTLPLISPLPLGIFLQAVLVFWGSGGFGKIVLVF